MELKVWVDGAERSVSGVSEETTCTQLIYALAHATGQKGKFVLVESYRGRERSLSPSDRPVEMLRRWQGAEGEVRYSLRRVDAHFVNGDEHNPSTAAAPDRSNYGYTRECSTSSINSVNLPYQPPRNGLHNGQNSTSSLPAYSEASLQRRRPPPPDYTSTMERKMAGLARTSEAARTGGIEHEEVPRIAELHLAPNDLLNLIQKQDAILDEQRSRLKIADLNLHSELEREYMQLDAQQKNLKRVLESLRRVDYGKQYEEETLRHRQLRAKVLATHEKLNLINESRTMLSEQESNLWQQIHDLSSEENNLFNTPHGTAFPFAKNNVHLTQFHSAI
ncbi:hypothetical protein PFISCL1PPCAC_28239 [Pristionchus fissidentatus]|uniref:Ras-associating domain-containing protein n=1 Tax=Pristionchus fissidentatus TaxID=1538716 RepID=A0AAV5X3L1_9BILA|nr:hypothetical protein PFISCL1PPCAC_28239 [Pristionchus fissidentatus]